MSELQSYDQLYPGRFLRAGQFLGKQRTLTIANVVHDELEGDKGKEQKVIMTFQETKLALVLCKLNATCIVGMFGKSIPAWIGKRVTFYPTDQLMPMPTAKGDDRMCIRVFGSPDIASDTRVEFKPPRRKALYIDLKCTKRAPAPSSANPMSQTQPAAMVRQEPVPQVPVPAVNGLANGPANPAPESCSGCGATDTPLLKGQCETCHGQTNEAGQPALGDAF